MDGKSYEGMAYLMNRGEISPPSQQYYNTILQGYSMFNASEEELKNNSVYRNAAALCILQIGELANRLTEKYCGSSLW